MVEFKYGLLTNWGRGKVDLNVQVGNGTDMWRKGKHYLVPCFTNLLYCLIKEKKSQDIQY